MDYPDGELSLVIVDDLRISELNRQYLGRSGPTNVITFPMREGDFADLTPGLLGDVVISVETARREAAAAGIRWETRMTALLIHGILHLFGYDHENDTAAAEKMQTESDRLMALIELKQRANT